MLGLCTPLAALGGACFMCFVVLTQPAFPDHLSARSAVVGHALLVNKDFVEMLALLVGRRDAGPAAGADWTIFLEPLDSSARCLANTAAANIARRRSESHGSETTEADRGRPASPAATSSWAAWPPAWWSAAGWGRSTSATTRPSARRLRVGVIGTGDEGSVLLGAINPDFIEVKAIADIRPYNIWRAFHGDITARRRWPPGPA